MRWACSRLWRVAEPVAGLDDSGRLTSDQGEDPATSGLRYGGRTWRRSAWKNWAGVVKLQPCQLSLTDNVKKRSRRALECSGPCPSMPCGKSMTRPETRFHFASEDATN